MSYENDVFQKLALPNRDRVINALLVGLLKHNGAVKEFGSEDQTFVDELADQLRLSKNQRSFRMQTIVRKEDRVKTFPAWHRLLFRSADLASKLKLLARPKDTVLLTGRREWMLTEKGIDKALSLSKISLDRKQELPIVTVEVQRVKRKLELAERASNYDPIDKNKKLKSSTRQSLLRTRGFRHAVLDAYHFSCCVCGLRLVSPDSLTWEVEAAHIVPHRFHGRDDIWNGLALCRFHHWCFDVGWFALRNDFTIDVHRNIHNLSPNQGLVGEFDIIRASLKRHQRIKLPDTPKIFPHEKAITWHRENIFNASS